MKIILVLLTATFLFKGLLAQNPYPCDAEMADTLSRENDEVDFLMEKEWSSLGSDSQSEEYNILLNGNKKFRISIGNSTHSESPLNFEFVKVGSESVAGDKVKIPVETISGKDTTVTVQTFTIKGKGTSEIIKQFGINPGEVSKYDFIVPKTGEYMVKLTSKKEGNNCSHLVLFYFK